ncbi:MAG: polynucleotide adenylyltransferase PcnB [Gammaproteobacteria bacterium]
MILKAARKWLARRNRPRRIKAEEHNIRPQQIGKNALGAVRKLAQAGYDSYIVGGAVRDLLLELKPKDFDIATAATPAQIRRLFRNSRIIGRRFRLIHLYFGGGEIVEVATFRARAEDSAREESGRILRDNRFGKPDDDAKRRDFTANALFYDPGNGEVLDYVGGFDDILQGKLRIIGKNEERIREDPVRMLRALRLAAKTKLVIAPGAARLFAGHANALMDIAPARLLDEFVKVIRSGCCATALRGWKKHKLAEVIFPQLADASGFAERAFADTDKRAAKGGQVSVSFVAAAAYWHLVGGKWLPEVQKGARPVGTMERALGEADFLANRVLSKRVAAKMTDLYFLLARMQMPATRKKRCDAIAANVLFERAIAFAKLEEGMRPLWQWWQQYADANHKERLLMMPSNKKRRAK